MDFNTILIQNTNSYNTSNQKKRSLPKSKMDYQQMVNNNQNQVQNSFNVNSFINMNENDFKPKTKKRYQKKEEISKTPEIVKELLSYFGDLNNNRVFKTIPLSTTLYLKLSKLEEVVEILSILKIIKLNGVDGYEWVGIHNEDFRNLLIQIQSSTFNYVTGEFEVICEKCKAKYNNQNHYESKLIDYSRFNIEHIAHQTLKLLINTKSPNHTSCVPLDLICQNFNRNVPIDKATFNKLKTSKQTKIAQLILKVLVSLNMVSCKVINTINVYYWEPSNSSPIQYCHF